MRQVANLPAGRQDWQTHYFEVVADSKSYIIMFYVYAMYSLDRNYIYVGLTNNIDKRFAQHNKGQNRSTKAYKPFALFYTETVQTRQEARIREKYLKSGAGKEFLRLTKNNAEVAKLVDALL